MTQEEAEDFLSKKAAEIGEHFDAVQILASFGQDSQWFCVKRGLGNWWARQGMAREFLNDDLAQQVGQQVANQIPPPPEQA